MSADDLEKYETDMELALYREVAAAYERAGGGRIALVEAPDRDAHLAKLTTSFAAASGPSGLGKRIW